MRKNIFIYLICVFLLSSCQKNHDFFAGFKDLTNEIYSTKGVKSKTPVYFRFNLDNTKGKKLILSQPYMPKETFENEGVDENLSNKIFENLFSTERNQAFLIQGEKIVSHEFLPTTIVIKNGYIVLIPSDNTVLMTYSETLEKVLVQKSN